MGLSFWANVAQILSFAVLLPVAIWKAFARLKVEQQEIRERLIRIESEFRPNGGSSLRDAMSRVERDLSKLTGRFDQHIEEN